MSHSQLSVIDSSRTEKDILQILLATDIHLGYAEEDPVRGPDTFETLEEILQIAVVENVDFVLLGGDLFHNAQPSPYCIYKCMELFKKYCLGDRPVRIEFLSDPEQNFKGSVNPIVNYEDPNINISLPVFSIHGNHDDPTGQKHVSSLDLMSTSGLINYFGRWNNFDKVEISPILLRKGETNLALYGLSHIRDERLGRLFLDNKVKMFSPPENDYDWFHLLVWHQNRASRGMKNFIPDHTLPDFLDLVVWGHEHDCRIEAERKPNNVFISQPGSSVATSLIQGESIPKKVGILKIHKKDFQIVPIELKTVRPFIYAEITLKDTTQLTDEDDNIDVSPSEHSKQLVTAKINSMIKEAKNSGHIPKVCEKPLIRLIVSYKNERQVFNTIRFGQSYIDAVANPENMVKFRCLKNIVRRKKVQKDQEEEEDIGPVLADRVEDLVSQHFKERDSLSLFALNSINEAVTKFIDSNDINAFSDVADTFMKETLKRLEKDSPDTNEIEGYILNFKKSMELDSLNFVNNILSDPKRQKPKVSSNEEVTLDESDEEITSNNKKQSRGKKGSAPRKGKIKLSSSEDVIDDDDEEIVRNSKKQSRGRGGRGAGAARKGKTKVSSNDSIVIDDDDEDNVFGIFKLGRGANASQSGTRARDSRRGRAGK